MYFCWIETNLRAPASMCHERCCVAMYLWSMETNGTMFSFFSQAINQSKVITTPYIIILMLIDTVSSTKIDRKSSNGTMFSFLVSQSINRKSFQVIV